MLIAVIVLGVLNLVLLAVIVLRAQKAPVDSSAQLIKQDLTTLSDNVSKLKDGLQSHLTERLDKSNAQMVKQFESSANIIKDVTAKLTQLEKTNQQVGDIAGELKVLQNVLSNPKQRGVLGEFYLEQILQNMLPPGTYELQHRLGDGMIVDAVIKLDGRLLPIDSKFSLENYNRLAEAKTAERPTLERTFKEDLKKRIDETAKYILPKKGTLEQALMFIPSEAIYYDLLANKVGESGVNGRDLMQYAAVEKRVTVVGPSTLSAMLQIVSQGLKSLEIQKDTDVIRKNVEQLGKHLHNVDGYFKRLGNSLSATVGHFNSTQKELGRVDKDVVKIAGGNAEIEPLQLDRPTNTPED
ncbi:MAG TPA: DNA recombination protein RmuC [Candidatus Saccharimonadales bacterium]|nr:DNA recombination protein RmuC [Candidatus Saccharimonadales bacterium]